VAPQRVAEPERDQDAGGIGRELDAGADLFELRRLIEDRDAETALRQRQSRREAADTRAGDHHGGHGGISDRSSATGHQERSCCGCRSLSDRVRERAFRRARGMWVEALVVAEQRRAIGADDLGGIAHVEKHVGMIERGLLAHAHEFMGADLDDGDTGGVVEVRNYSIGHDGPNPRQAARYSVFR
jgi:hypothetical protein